LEAVSRELREALASRVGVLAIDLAAVTAIDPMGLQLLLAARAGERAEGRSLAFVAASQAVCELCEAVGLPLAHWVKVG
jgi:ABC-type transporter Mla MlaB component